MPNSESDIQVEWSDDELHIFSEHGSLLGVYEPESQELVLKRGDVLSGFRKHGEMGRLLERSIIEAKKIGARAISATCISRESMDAGIRVFGEDAITIHHIGEYENPDLKKPPILPSDQRNTMATLLFVMKP